ncbi:MAG: helix-turn-helix domain-containing protein [Methyloprofundus sp.]|nr:helix-turn-helix domain-containing protein [Methyloprofundus sp.]
MSSNFYFSHSNINDFEKLCEFNEGFEIEFKQLEKGNFSSETLTFADKNMFFSTANIERRMRINGASTKGLISFGLMSSLKSSLYWRNIDIDANKLFVFPESREFYSISSSNFDILSFSLSEEKLNQVCESFELFNIKSLINSHEVFLCEPQIIGELRHYLLSIKFKLMFEGENYQNSFFLREMEQELASRIVCLLAKNQTSIHRKKIRKRDLAIKVVETYVSESKEKVISVADLCNVACISERALEYAFKERYKMTPKAFLLNHKLNNVNKQLRLADPESTFVYEIAQQHGFWHMGQFSADYKKLFGNSPSTVLGLRCS